MTKLRGHNLSVSLDSYLAGPRQSLESPMGEGGMDLHKWVFNAPAGRRMFGMEPHEQQHPDDAIHDRFIEAGTDNIGATIMGRNMFGPIRGSWDGSDWIGWWEEEPPFHHDVFVLTQHPRDDLTLIGTTFHFVTGGIHEAHERALVAAAGRDIRVGGGASTIRQYLSAGLIDHLHVAVAPVLLGAGEALFADVPLLRERYETTEVVPTEAVTHVVLSRR